MAVEKGFASKFRQGYEDMESLIVMVEILEVSVKNLYCFNIDNKPKITATMIASGTVNNFHVSFHVFAAFFT